MTHMKKLRVDLSRLFLVTSACPGQMTGSGSLQQSFPLQMQVNKLHGRAVTCGNQTVTASVFMQNILFFKDRSKGHSRRHPGTFGDHNTCKILYSHQIGWPPSAAHSLRDGGDYTTQVN